MASRNTTAPGGQRLPNLPLPPIENFFERFMDFVSPLPADNKEETVAYCKAMLDALKANGDDASTSYLRQLERHSQVYKKFCNEEVGVSHMSMLWNTMYLGNRDPLLVGWNYSLYLTSPPHTTLAASLGVSPAALRAAVLGSASFHARRLLSFRVFPTKEGQERLPRDCRIDLKLCRDQYARTLRSVRIPHRGMDGICVSNTNDVLLMRHGHLVVYTWSRHCDGIADRTAGTEALPSVCAVPDELWAKDVVVNALRIHRVLSEVDALPVVHDNVAVLSNGNRTTWADCYEALWTSEKHQGQMRRLAHCAFAFAFDDAINDVTATVNGGPHPANRFPDMGVTYFIDPDGRSSCSMEHSWGDGHSMMFVSRILSRWTLAAVEAEKKGSNALKLCVNAKTASSPAVTDGKYERLAFENIPAAVVAGIQEAHAIHTANSKDVDVTTIIVPTFGADKIKTACKCSPDAFVHAAFHLAQSRLFGDQRSTYCALLMKPYHTGRTETLRTVTDSTVRLAAVVEEEMNRLPSGSVPRPIKRSPQDLPPGMLNTFESKLSSPSLLPHNAEVRKALHACSAAHRDRLNICRAGKGFHRTAVLLRHLHADLKKRLAKRAATDPRAAAALEAAAQLDEKFFSTSAFRELSSDYLSTSSLGGPGVQFFGFGPTHGNGVGIGYSAERDSIHFTTSSLRTCARQLRSGEKGAPDMYNRFAEVAMTAFEDLYALSSVDPSKATLTPSAKL